MQLKIRSKKKEGYSFIMAKIENVFNCEKHLLSTLINENGYQLSITIDKVKKNSIY